MTLEVLIKRTHQLSKVITEKLERGRLIKSLLPE